LSQSYGYDLLDRLTSATGTSLSQGWTYDANGNRLTQTGSAASTYIVNSSSNRLSSISGALTRTYSYDNSGNMIGDGSATFTYNDAGRMISATKASVTTTYALNALGQRVKKTTSGSSRYFVYDEAGHLVGEYDNSGNLIQETVWFGDTPVATLRPNGAGVNLFYVHTDHLNTPRRISRPSDNVVLWRWDSDPFGTTVANEDPDGDSNLFAYSLRLAGQYFDAETGLHYNYMRDYDPAVGRYVESDPIGLDGGLNTYLYAQAQPLLHFDPYGLDATNWSNTEGGRSRRDGPTNGNWGGKCWSGGKYSCGKEKPGNKPPTDSGDQCYKTHDLCYTKCEAYDPLCIAKCDRTLVDELWKLDNDPRKWPMPPKPGTERDTVSYRLDALYFFSRRLQP
jgi:RHS repeat-associated protein